MVNLPRITGTAKSSIKGIRNKVASMPCEVINVSGNLISVRITGELKKAELDQMQTTTAEPKLRAQAR